MHSLGTAIAFNDEAFGSNVIAGNFLGTDASGTVYLGGGSIFVDNNANNVIGGPDPSDRNLIAGAIEISGAGSTGNRVYGNFIGVDVTGTATFSNSAAIGISSGASNNMIGLPGGLR